jgi:hypothetical protein
VLNGLLTMTVQATACSCMSTYLCRCCAVAVELVEQAAHGAHGFGVKLPGSLGVNRHAHLARLGVHTEGGLQQRERQGSKKRL